MRWPWDRMGLSPLTKKADQRNVPPDFETIIGTCHECGAPCTDKDIVGNQIELGFPVLWCGKCVDFSYAEYLRKHPEQLEGGTVPEVISCSDYTIPRLVEEGDVCARCGQSRNEDGINWCYCEENKNGL